MSASEFASDIDEGLDEALERAETVIRLMALDLLSGLVLKTPVDIGRARGNWGVSVGVPLTGEFGADPGGGETIARGQAVIGSYQLETFQPIWLTNNLPYIQKLDGGSSTQAPAGMTALTIAEVEAKYADIEL